MTEYWIWLATRSQVGPVAIKKIMERFPTPEAVFQASEGELRQVEDLNKRELAGLLDHDMTTPKLVLEDCAKLEIEILTMGDEEYPQRLLDIAGPPPVLYYRGQLPDFDEEAAVGIVGTRDATPYGVYMAKKLGYQISHNGGLVVSGHAEGIDAASLEGALLADRPVVSVMGCGVDVIYPGKNKQLLRDVAARGCLISEYPPGSPPIGGHFPVRNRIISGLSLGVVVVEAGSSRSGALLTANCALEQGRDVFAIPGNVGSRQSRGCNALIRQGATLVRGGRDVLQEYEALFPQKLHLSQTPLAGQTERAVPQLKVASPVAVPRAVKKAKTGAEEKIPVDKAENGAYIDLQELKNTKSSEQMELITQLLDGPAHADDLVERTGLPTGSVSSALCLLEVEGLVEKLPGRRYRLAVQVREG